MSYKNLINNIFAGDMERRIQYLQIQNEELKSEIMDTVATETGNNRGYAVITQYEERMKEDIGGKKGNDQIKNVFDLESETYNGLPVFDWVPSTLDQSNRCCNAAIRIRYPHGRSRYYLRQCRRKKTNTNTVKDCQSNEQNSGIFCRQHECFPPTFVYTHQDTDNRTEMVMPSPTEKGIVDVQLGKEIEQPNNNTKPMLQHIDDMFRLSIEELKAVKRKQNNADLRKFKQNVLENLTTNLALMGSALDSTDANTTTEDDELCEYE